ncbi:MAG: pentapeptide repeat-containing protein [Candidatus Hydrogenedentes bacterium]|nr:pentapeptide repeat-containing protein [Candidatus Hydrogenedentota bacterium]
MDADVPAKDALISGPDAMRQWTRNNPRASFHVAGIEFGRVEISGLSNDEWIVLHHAQFGGTKFEQLLIINADLSNTNFNHLIAKEAEFTNVTLDASSFANAKIESLRLNNVRCNGSTEFTNAYLPAAKFSDCTFDNTKFTNAELMGAAFTRGSLMYVDFSGANLDGCTFASPILASSLAFWGTKNLETSTGLEKINIQQQTGIHGDAIGLEQRERPRWKDYLDWTRIRVLGRLPLFGISYATLVFIPVIIGSIAMVNTSIERIQEAGLVGLSGNSFEGVIPAVKIPTLMVWSLIAAALLAIASTLYHVFCPTRIQEFTQEQWVNELNKPLMHYLPHAWKMPRIRIICIWAYAVGGLSGLFILSIKAFQTIGYIVRYGE